MQEDFRLFIMWLLYVQLLGTEQMRACLSRYDKSAWNANQNDEGGNDAHIASTGVQLYYRTARVDESKNETGN